MAERTAHPGGSRMAIARPDVINMGQTAFDEQHPNIAQRMQNGRIEIGRDDYGTSFIHS